MAQLNWRLKSAAFKAVDLVGPAPLYWAQKHLTGRARRPFREMHPAWRFHRDHLQFAGAKRVLEFGAGKDLSQNLYLRGVLDIEQVLVDLNPMLDFGLINRGIDSLAAFGIPTQGHVGSLEALRETYGITYAAPVDMRATGFEAGSFDACISNSTLEHIPTDVLPAIWSEIIRVLKPGGLVSARIDYSDHYAHTDRSISRLNFLRFSEQEWRRHNHGKHYQNRLRHKHHLDLMTASGLIIESERCASPADPTGLSLHPDNLTGDQSDYCTEGYIYAVSR